jgi:hypothetical protein
MRHCGFPPGMDNDVATELEMLVQSMHLNGYGLTPGRGQEPYATIGGIVAEATRVPANSPHVAHPIKPNLVYGVDPMEVGEEAASLALRARDRAGRKLRSNGVVLLAGVVSYPMPISSMGEFVSDYDAYNLWRGMVVDWLMQEHGDRLKSVVEHVDEDMLHLHFFTLPILGVGNRLDFAQAHPGRDALNDAVDRGVCKAAQQAVYTQAMIDYQDRLHSQVSAFFGHERLGPRRRRIERERHKVVRQGEKDLSRLRAELEFEYWAPASENEAHQRSRLVSKSDFIAVAAEEQKKLQAEIARLKNLLNVHGIDDRPDSAPLAHSRPWPGADEEFDTGALPPLGYH